MSKTAEVFNAESILEKHCPSMCNLYLDAQGRNFRDRVVKAMIEFAASHPPAAPVSGEDLTAFLECVTNERNEFCGFINSLLWDSGLRTKCESLLIIYDQMKERLSATLPTREPEGEKFIVDANEPKYLIGVLKNIEREMPKAKRKRTLNISMVRDYLTGHTSKGGRVSAYETCLYLGIDPDGTSVNTPSLPTQSITN